MLNPESDYIESFSGFKFFAREMNKSKKDLSIVIMGFGRVGKVLASAFVNHGYNLSGIIEKEHDGNETSINESLIPVYKELDSEYNDFNVLILCLPDMEISGVVEELVNSTICKSGMTVVHTAGSQSSEVFSQLRQKGADVLAWHPMQTFTGDEDIDHIKGITFGIDGNERGLKLGRQISIDLGANFIEISPEDRVKYHLAGIYASNFLSALTILSTDFLHEIGVSEEQAMKTILPLMETTIKNISEKGLPGAISGPLVRDDYNTLIAHQKELAKEPEKIRLYRMFSRILLRKLDISRKLPIDYA